MYIQRVTMLYGNVYTYYYYDIYIYNLYIHTIISTTITGPPHVYIYIYNLYIPPYDLNAL